MGIQYLKQLKIIHAFRNEKFIPILEQQQKSIITSILDSLILLEQGINSLLRKKVNSILARYLAIANAFLSLQVANSCFTLCKLEFKEIFIKHNKQSLDIYNFARKFFNLSLELLQEVFADSKDLDYLASKKFNQDLIEFHYHRKLLLFNYISDAMKYLVYFQKGTNLLVLNWDLRLKSFFILRNISSYRDLLDRRILQPYFNEKEKIIQILTSMYEHIILDLKRDYEITNQDFFARNVNTFLEEYRRFNLLLKDKEKVIWIDKQMSSWNRMRKMR